MTTNGKQLSPRHTLLDESDDPRYFFRDLRWPFGLGAWRPLVEREQPALDMFDRNGSVVVNVEMPGFKAEDIDVNVTNGQLTISGERHEESEVREEDVYRRERSFGRIVRSVTLPKGCDAGATQATLKEGVLEVTIPKTAGSTPTKIDVKAA